MHSIFGRSCAVAVIVPLLAWSSDQLEDQFVNPPAEAKAHTWWHWMNGNITKEGITADLEAMARIGVGGAQIFNVAQGEPVGPVKVLSAEWQALMQHAIKEADRVGVELAVHNCPGWSESGGPWVKPQDSMQEVVWSETTVQGPASFAAPLRQPTAVQGFYRDIAVYAFPTLPGDGIDLAALDPNVTASVSNINSKALLDADPNTFVSFSPPPKGATHHVQFEFRTPITFASVRVWGRGNNIPTGGWIEASDDGVKYRKLATLSFIHGGVPFAVADFGETRARFIRIGLSGTSWWTGKRWEISGVELATARLSNVDQKAGYVPNASLRFSDREMPAPMCIDPARVVNLSDKLKPDGQLAWEVPAGRWTIIRLGHTSTGRPNAPAPDSGRGLECDKMNRAAVEAHFNAMMGALIAQAGPLAGKSLKMVLADSWEAGCQNWTPAFIAEFKHRRGYDPTPWLPVLTGRALGSVEQSERFLWDFRRTIADLIAENHYATFQRLCAEHGMAFTAEAPGIGMPTIAEQLQCKKYTDVTMGEFWVDGHNDSREPACAAHIYGKKFVSAESFTANTPDAKWAKTPFDLKALGDLNYCRGLNRFVFHRYAMQPWTNRAPGMTMGPWGTNFERTQTWWEQAKAWMTYLQRCQFMLQQGLFVADIAYFYGEGAPNTITGREPRLPTGYDFDAINTDVLFNRVKVQDGRLVLPDGMSYRLLLLPESNRMTPAVLQRIAELVKAGAVVVGPRPEKSPSLNNWPAADAMVAKLAAKVWGDCDGQKITTHAYGKGRVIWGQSLADVLTELGVRPDWTASGDAECAAIHRHMGDVDAYFVSNQRHEPVNASLTFRVGARMPELWHPESGAREGAPAFTVTNGLVTVPLHFDPAGSVFVVFRKSAAGKDPVQSFARDGHDLFAPESAPPAGALEIRHALFGVDPLKNERCVDVTAQLNAAITNGRLNVIAGNNLAGDPAHMTPKRMVVDYAFNGRPRRLELSENARLHLPVAVDLGSSALPPPAAELAVQSDGQLVVNATVPGRYKARTAAGRTLLANVTAVPAPLPIAGPWTLNFPPNWGAPAQVNLDRLISWTAHPDDGVKHFSGTATYLVNFDVPAELQSLHGQVLLDLGCVHEIAEVKLNGQDLGILWKPPFRVDITSALRPSHNQLAVRVTNLWPNRLIGDAALPEDKRYTWTTFQPYKPDDPLLESGLLGPVRLVPVVRVPVVEAK